MEDKEYKVGKGKPPKDRQFKKGKSGNPLGRQKGVRNLKTAMTDIMGGKIPASVDGKRRMVSKREALLLRMMADALRGNLKAAGKLLDLDLRLSGNDLPGIAESLEKTADNDRRIIERFLARHGVRPDKATESK